MHGEVGFIFGQPGSVGAVAGGLTQAQMKASSDFLAVQPDVLKASAGIPSLKMSLDMVLIMPFPSRRLYSLSAGLPSTVLGLRTWHTRAAFF